jgi:hypothetical protein
MRPKRYLRIEFKHTGHDCPPDCQHLDRIFRLPGETSPNLAPIPRLRNLVALGSSVVSFLPSPLPSMAIVSGRHVASRSCRNVVGRTSGSSVAGAFVDDDERVAIIELDWPGGACLSHCCKPTEGAKPPTAWSSLTFQAGPHRKPRVLRGAEELGGVVVIRSQDEDHWL